MTNQNRAAQAIQEAERIAAADEYFQARTWIMDTNDNRRIFEAGFDRAYALLSKLRAPVAESTDRAMLQSVLQDLEKSESVCPRCGYGDSCADMDVAHMIRDHLKGDASAPVAGEAVALELRGVPETIKEGGGFWRSCTGCHELNEGRDTGPYSAVLGCHLGQGCSECGGIGAIWDSTDYQTMADDMARDMGQSVSAAPQASAEGALTAPADVAQLVAFIFDRFGQPGDAGALPDNVAAAVRRLERGIKAQADKDGEACAKGDGNV